MLRAQNRVVIERNSRSLLTFRMSATESMTMKAQQMISTHPDVRGNFSDPLVRCIEECYDCAQVCTTCADACLAEEMVQQLRQCIL